MKKYYLKAEGHHIDIVHSVMSVLPWIWPQIEHRLCPTEEATTTKGLGGPEEDYSDGSTQDNYFTASR